MIFTKGKFRGVFIIEPELVSDDRGYHTRIFCKKEYRTSIKAIDIKQLNRSLSLKKGIIRGLHYQLGSSAEDKFLVQCLKGSLYGVIADIRKESRTFGQWMGVELTEENMKMLFVPKGLAFGIQALKNSTILQYAVSAFYVPTKRGGIRWDDPYFNFKWPIKNTIVSKVDQSWPLFNP